MKDDIEYILLICTLILMGLMAMVSIKVTDRLDQIDKRIEQLEDKPAAYVPEVATLTDASTPGDATPTEPSEDALSISIRPEYLATETDQEAQFEVLEEEPEEIVTEEPKADPEPSESYEIKSAEPTGLSYLGTYELTAYAWTGNPCANGNYPQVGYTVASNSIPMGSRILIEGYGEYVVEDCGGMAGNVIDVYMGDYDTCIQFGRRTADVYIVE